MATTLWNTVQLLFRSGFVEADELTPEADHGVLWGDFLVAGDAFGVPHLDPIPRCLPSLL